MMKENPFKKGIFILAFVLWPVLGMASSEIYRGILKTGLVAIGGETTGFGIETPTGQFEISFEEKRELLPLAKTLNDKNVVIQGKLTVRHGVEIPVRRIIVVQTLKLDDEQQ